MSLRRHPRLQSRTSLAHACAAGLLCALALGSPGAARAQDGAPVVEQDDVQDAAPPEDQRPTATGTLLAGFGVAARTVDAATAQGPYRVPAGAFPAWNVTLRTEVAAADLIGLGIDARYHSSIALAVKEHSPGGAGGSSHARSHHFDASFVPSLHLAPSADGVTLGATLGWGVRALHTLVPLSLPSYTLHGPLFGLLLRVPLAGGPVELRVRPELWILAFVSDELRDAAGLSSPGLAWGGEACASVRLSAVLSLELAYHGARGTMSSNRGPFADEAHDASLRLGVTY